MEVKKRKVQDGPTEDKISKRKTGTPTTNSSILKKITSIIFLHKASPIPLPPAGVLVFEPTVKGSKISN